MLTFSQLTNRIAHELLRPDLKLRFADYLNQTIRDLHSDSRSGYPILFGSNRLEDEFVVAADPPVWTIPNVARFQQVEAIWNVTQGKYHIEKNPAKSKTYQSGTMREHFHFWYRSGPIIALGGAQVDDELLISWFEYPPRLFYYDLQFGDPKTAAPATRSEITGEWTYHADYNSTPELQAEAQLLSTNWMLDRWPDLLMQGVRNKNFVRLGELDRAKMSFSAFETEKSAMIAAETWNIQPKD